MHKMIWLEIGLTYGNGFSSCSMSRNKPWLRNHFREKKPILSSGNCYIPKANIEMESSSKVYYLCDLGQSLWMSILFIATYRLFNQSKTLIGHLLSSRHYFNSVNSPVLNNNKISTTHFKYNIHITSFTH